MIVAELGPRKVYVGGEVRLPGVVLYRDGMTPMQAILDRGGFTEVARIDSVLHVTSKGNTVEATRLDFSKEIIQGSPELTALAVNDVIYVPQNFHRRRERVRALVHPGSHADHAALRRRREPVNGSWRRDYGRISSRRDAPTGGPQRRRCAGGGRQRRSATHRQRQRLQRCRGQQRQRLPEGRRGERQRVRSATDTAGNGNGGTGTEMGTDRAQRRPGADPRSASAKEQLFEILHVVFKRWRLIAGLFVAVALLRSAGDVLSRGAAVHRRAARC